MADYTTNLGLEKIEPGTKPYYEKEWSNLDKIDANNPKHNFTATADPTSTNDSSEGYGVGSVWINTSTKTIFQCTDTTTGNADWDEVTKTDLSNVLDATVLDKVKNVDGSGSGLDADLLDGHDSTYFLSTTGKAADSDKLDGYDSATTPTANTIPIADSNGKLNAWVDATSSNYNIDGGNSLSNYTLDQNLDCGLSA